MTFATTLTDPVTSHGESGSAPRPARREADVFDVAAEVISNNQVNADYCHLVVQAGECAAYAKAGQFFQIACPMTAADQPYLRRPMSIYRIVPSQGRLEFLYKITGAGTRGLATLHPGDRVAMHGPLGNGFWLESGWQNIVVLGRGVGLATLAPLAELATERGIKVTAILSARSHNLVMSVERFAAAGAQVEVVTDDRGSSELTKVERLLLDLIGEGRADAFFTCGSNRLMLLMQGLAAKFDIPGQVALEQQMACGLGMCFCCVREFRSGDTHEQRRVCFDGPVFRLAEALSW